ncbi:MAG: LysM peptidoglycan-binding domain-containing protein [Pedosphaera sp.]|nr:LysM peptidoglycan-binding domain-containing protein [Pedosphaera sp.]
MNLILAASRWFGPALLGLMLVGCNVFTGNNESDEQKEAHYLTGKSRVQGRDYKGAADAFKKAIEVNPQSASAHLELGLLYADKLNENPASEDERDRYYASAIYHLENYLHLSPNPVLGDRVRQQISACKLELARTVSFTQFSSTVQTELERLHRTNTTQRAQIEQLRVEMAQQAFAHSNRIAALQAEYTAALNARVAASQGNAPSAGDPAPSPKAPASSPTPPAPSGGQIGKQGGQIMKPSVQQNSRPASLSTSTASSRIHKVQQGDTPASIARKYGVSLSALQTANPSLEPRRMRVGQTINIPGAKN